MDLQELRLQVWHANIMLPKTGLVTMHSGNASGFDPETKTLFIKPSGCDYDALRPEDLPRVNLDGEVVEGELKPSVDLPHHLFLYRERAEIGGIIHTHSNYATSFAALGKSIPLCLTAIADEFGDEIPCAPYVDNEGEHIGEGILKASNRSPAVLMGNHGVFAWGKSPKDALKAAIMVEDVAKTVHLAMVLGDPKPIPPEEAEKWYQRYHTTYGQK